MEAPADASDILDLKSRCGEEGGRDTGWLDSEDATEDEDDIGVCTPPTPL